MSLRFGMQSIALKRFVSHIIDNKDQEQAKVLGISGFPLQPKAGTDYPCDPQVTSVTRPRLAHSLE